MFSLTYQRRIHESTHQHQRHVMCPQGKQLFKKNIQCYTFLKTCEEQVTTG